MTDSNKTNNDDDIIDLEVFAQKGERPPKGKKYRFKVNATAYVVNKEVLTGKEILEISDNRPPEAFLLSQVLKGGSRTPVGLDEKVDLTTPGIEKFKVLPKKQNEG